MTNDIKYTWFVAQNGTNKSKRIRKAYYNKITRLNTILENTKAYNITLGEETTRSILMKRSFYNDQVKKLSHFIHKFELRDKNSAMKYIEHLFPKGEVEKYESNKTFGIRKFIKKFKKIF